LDNRVASPTEIAAELGAGLSNTSYHVRQLMVAKLIRLVKRRQVRGAIEHYYTATVRPTITDTGWAQMPEIVKRRYLGGKIAQIGKEVATAAGQGGFDRPEMHLTRTSMRVTPDQWKKAAKILERALEEIEQLGSEGAAPAAGASGDDEFHAIAVMMLFEAEAPDRGGATGRERTEPDDCPASDPKVT
jgi:hypothetical protein